MGRCSTTLSRVSLVLALCGAAACQTTALAGAQGGVEAGKAASAVVELANTFRQSQNRPPLKRNDALTATARDFARYMADTGKYGHHADGRTPSQRAAAHGYAYCSIAENIEYQQRSSGFTTQGLAQALVEGWESSPPHRRNLLDPDLSETGAGVAQSERTGRWYAVQLFGLPRSAQTSVSITNRADSAVSYRIGNRTFELTPRMTRTHKRCGATTVVVQWPGGQPPSTLEPHGESHYVVEHAAGGWRIERE
jgi:uncharacterized protein YkwD